MRLPRDLSGEQLIRTLCRNWDYRRTGQVGSQSAPVGWRSRVIGVEIVDPRRGRQERVGRVVVRWVAA